MRNAEDELIIARNHNAMLRELCECILREWAKRDGTTAQIPSELITRAQKLGVAVADL